MLRGFFIGVITAVLLAIVVIENNCALVDAVAPHAKHAPNPIKKFISEKNSSCYGLTTLDIYNRKLAVFQTFSTGDKYTRPSAKKYGDYYIQRLRFTYLPSSQPYWFFEVFRYPDETSDDIIILAVKKYDPDSENIEILESDKSRITTERTIKTFSASTVTSEEFQSAMQEIMSKGVFDPATAKSDSYSEPKSSCIDGVSYFVEIKRESNWVLIDGACDEEKFDSDLQLITPLLELTRQHLPQVGNYMSEDDGKLLGFSDFSEIENP